MADLSGLTDFTPGTTIVSSEVDANFSAIVTYINNRQNGTTAFDQVKSVGQLQAQPTTNQLLLGNPSAFHTVITSPAPAATRTVTLPDAGGNSSFVLTAGSQTISGTKTFDGQLIGKGTATNDSASTGYIGEYVSSSVSVAQAAATSGNFDDLTSISLTAGDWDVSACIWFLIAGSTWSEVQIGINTTAGNNSTGTVAGTSRLQAAWANSSTTPTSHSMSLPLVRMSIAATTTVYLKRTVTYTAGTPTSIGFIGARRVR